MNELNKNLTIFDTTVGDKPATAADDFLTALANMINADMVSDQFADHDVTITVGNIQLKAYDNAQLICSLYQAVVDYMYDIS